jgi:hypothetical protein
LKEDNFYPSSVPHQKTQSDPPWIGIILRQINPRSTPLKASRTVPVHPTFRNIHKPQLILPRKGFSCLYRFPRYWYNPRKIEFVLKGYLNPHITPFLLIYEGVDVVYEYVSWKERETERWVVVPLLGFGGRGYIS